MGARGVSSTLARMEKRVLLAIVLCVGVLVGWSWIQEKFWPAPPRKPVKPPVTAPAVPGDGAQAGGVPQPPALPEDEDGGGDAAGPADGTPATEEAIRTERIEADVLSTGGGAFKALRVWGCDHHEPGDDSVHGDPGILTQFVEGTEPALALDVSAPGASGLSRRNWAMTGDDTGTTATTEAGGLLLTKELRVSADPAQPYHFDLIVTCTNQGAKPGAAALAEIVGPWTPAHGRDIIPEDGILAAPEGDSVDDYKPTSIAEELQKNARYELRSEKGWRFIGMRSDFYFAGLRPLDPLPITTTVGFRAAKVSVEVSGKPTWVDVAAPTLRIPFEVPAAGASTTWKFMVYSGPNSRTLLRDEESVYAPFADAYPNRTFLIFSFGPIANFLGWLLSHLANSLHMGWGLAVCGLTVLVRGALFPLSRKTQISMRVHGLKMARLKPKLDALKEKFKDNPKKQQEETMKLFRTEKVSILPGGCLLAFLQMPVWISLYATLQTTFEMRHAGFLWFSDLTSADHLAYIPALREVWWLGNYTEGWFNLLPILMMGAWFGSSAMQPLPEDPDQRSQAKMMRWIPLMFGFFLYRYASGLALYMTLSALWSIGESWLIRKLWLSKMEKLPVPAPKSR